MGVLNGLLGNLIDLACLKALWTFDYFKFNFFTFS